jgi:uncharacterized membrane protein YhaH (DUF805 family)
MPSLEEVIFPKRLRRIPFLVRIVIADVCLWLLLGLASSHDPMVAGLRLLAICGGAFIIAVYSLFFVLLPRVHDAGWSSWWIIVGLFPYVGPLFHFLMLFIPPAPDAADQPI